jgi:hypothetical protein
VSSTLSRVDLVRLEMSEGRTVMDQITESLLDGFSSEHELKHVEESKQFEHFVAHLVIGLEQPESFETEDVVVGDGSTTQGGGDTARYHR